MIACKDCGKLISPDAMQCPQCGANVANSPRKVATRFILVALLLSVIWWFVRP